MKNNANNLFLIVLLLFLPFSLFGYLDPGSGSMLFSALIGIVATLFFMIKGFFFKIIDFFRYFSGKNQIDKSKTNNIVFYSEGSRYFNVFLPVLRELNNRKIKVTYLSSEENDPGLKTDFEFCESKFIGTGNKAFFFLNTLEADICVMTTPGLDVLQIKRSKGVKKYLHITHSAGGCSGYSTFGLDYYDIVATGGEADKKMIEELEETRNLTKKEIVVTGCTYLDVFREKLKNIKEGNYKFNNDKKTVLVSPTWGEHGLLNKFGEKLIQKLIEAKSFNIIVRPHPQSFVSEKNMIENLIKKFPENETFKWDKEPEGLKTMMISDIMISDFSGIIFDFMFLFEKPVLSFKGNYDKRGKDAMDLKDEPWNIKTIDFLKMGLNNEDVDKIAQIINEKLENKVLFSDKLQILRKDMDKYPNESGQRVADLIEKHIIKDKKIR